MSSVGQIVGLDLSLKATGIAWLDYDGRVHVRTVRTDTPDHDFNGWSASRRYRVIAAEVAKHVGPDTIVVKEHRMESTNIVGNTILDLTELHAVVNYVLASRRVPIVKVNLQTLKAYAIRGQASKDDMVAAAGKQLGDYVQVFNDNEADALWLLAMGCDRYGRRLTNPATHRGGNLARVDWHQWAWPANGLPSAKRSAVGTAKEEATA